MPIVLALLGLVSLLFMRIELKVSTSKCFVKRCQRLIKLGNYHFSIISIFLIYINYWYVSIITEASDGAKQGFVSR